MKDYKAKILFILFLIVSILCVKTLIKVIRNIPKSNPSNWVECEGHIIERSKDTALVEYQANEELYYYMRNYIGDDQNINSDDPIKMYYYRDNPKECYEYLPSLYMVSVVVVALFTCVPVYATAFIYAYIITPKKGKKLKLKFIGTELMSNMYTNIYYKFLWKEDNKIKYLRDMWKPSTYKSVLEVCGIQEVNCYVRSDKSKFCNADFDGTLEEKNIVLSLSNKKYYIK